MAPSWLGNLWKGSHSSSLPYSIKSEPLFAATRHGSHGWAIHEATKKVDDGGQVTAFQANKVELAKTPLRKSASLSDARYSDTSSQATQLIPALHHFHQIKRLIHPRILRVHATLDTDYPDDTKLAPGLDALNKTLATGTLIIVTEKATPLDDWLEGLNPHTAAANAAAVSWGLHNIVEALGFLHSQAKLAHGFVCPDAIFVTPAGDFKLGGLDLVTPVGPGEGETGGGPTPHFRSYEGAVCPQDYRSPERTGQRYDELQQSSPVHAMDCFSLAVLIAHVYAHPNAGTGGQVPGPLRKALARMQNQAPRLRPRLAPLLRCPVFDNPYVKAEVFLDEVPTKPVEEKIMFLQSLPDVLNRGVLNENVAIHKILPLLVQGIKSTSGNEAAMTQDVHRREIMAIVPLLFQIAESYLTENPELFHRHVTPLVPLLFAINDRGVRGAVLQKMTLIEGQLDDKAINTSVFEPMCSGFSDSSAPLRELTLKATIVLVPKLNPSNLEKLVRYLVRLQSDPEASIRTNTVIFIGKIAANLTEISRQKLILPAFIRAMKDVFTPCRLSALRAVLACREYFSQRDVAEKVLPCVVPHTLDAVGEVRDEAFQVVDALLVGLRKESQSMAQEAAARISAATCGMSEAGTDGKDASAAASEAAPSSGGYLSGLSSWMATATDNQGTVDDRACGRKKTIVAASTALRPAVPGPKAPKFSSLSLSDAQIGGAPGYGHNGGGSGWSDDDNNDDSAPAAGAGDGDGWDDNDFVAPSLPAEARSTAPTKAKVPLQHRQMEDDDFFSSFGSKPTKPSGRISTLGTKSGRLVVPKKAGTLASLTAKTAPQMNSSSLSGTKMKKQQRPTVKELPANDLMDGWDDF